ncbi:MAG: MerR family DNA-binding transcriptional regulator [Erysipelotrichaceae bacterium]|nr:MerR family DNA-binding transcriptional regulator [Erysipelotrichaceae bacterium]
MKEYSICELSELLGISREMVRYYEKCGAISLSRNNENNYRIYVVGSAVKAGNALVAMKEGFEAALKL